MSKVYNLLLRFPDGTYKFLRDKQNNLDPIFIHISEGSAIMGYNTNLIAMWDMAPDMLEVYGLERQIVELYMSMAMEDDLE